MDKFSELAKLEKKELLEKVAILRKESLNLRFQKSSGQLEKTAKKAAVSATAEAGASYRRMTATPAGRDRGS